MLEAMMDEKIRGNDDFFFGVMKFYKSNPKMHSRLGLYSVDDEIVSTLNLFHFSLSVVTV